jgi:hypothetical protein
MVLATTLALHYSVVIGVHLKARPVELRVTDYNTGPKFRKKPAVIESATLNPGQRGTTKMQKSKQQHEF